MTKQSNVDPCPYCQARRLVKVGRKDAKYQPYLCRACGKTFTYHSLERQIRDQRAVEMLGQGRLFHEVRREISIPAYRLKQLQAKHLPHLSLPNDKPKNLAEYLEQVQLRKLTKKEWTEAAQWITALHAQELLGLTKKSITDLIKRGRLEGRKEHKRLWVSAASVEAYQPMRVGPRRKV